MSQVAKLKQIIEHFKIKYDPKLDLKKQPDIMKQLAVKLNIVLKGTFSNKMKMVFKAFNDYAKRRQLFSQDKSSKKESELDRQIRANNTFVHRSGIKQMVPEAQKFLFPNFQAPRQEQGLLKERDIDRGIIKQIELSREIEGRGVSELKDLVTQLLPKEQREQEQEQARLFAGERDILSKLTEEQQDVLASGGKLPKEVMSRLDSSGRDYVNLLFGEEDENLPNIVIDHELRTAAPSLGNRIETEADFKPFSGNSFDTDSLFSEDSL